MPRWWLTRVQGRSMVPALRDGQLALTRSLRPGAVVRRGDLVVADAGRRVVKRVVGLPGERVAFRDGRVVIDGIGLVEPYATSSVFRGEFAVPPGHYLLLGDHRDASDDARSWLRPYLARRQLVGRLVRSRRFVARLRTRVGTRGEAPASVVLQCHRAPIRCADHVGSDRWVTSQARWTRRSSR